VTRCAFCVANHVACAYACNMPDPTWKAVRIRAALFERIESLAKPAERSVASYIESLLEAALARQASRAPMAMASLRNAMAEAEEKGAGQAAVILRTVIERESAS
jgi:hypothetical protein